LLVARDQKIASLLAPCQPFHYALEAARLHALLERAPDVAVSGDGAFVL
jgi:hypothetical protein